MHSPPHSRRLLLIVVLDLLLRQPLPSRTAAASSCPDSCGDIAVNYPFGLRDGCGARQYRNILNCTTAAAGNATAPAALGDGAARLYLQTPSGGYPVQSIDYRESTMVIYDPFMSTCSGGGGAPQRRRDFVLSDSQYLTIVPSPDTFFALLNCSSDSPLLHRLSRVCAASLSGHSCAELYACPSFQPLGSSAASSGSIAGRPASSSASSSPAPCCFTRYDTLRYTTMEILDCSGVAFVYGMDRARGIAAADWSYGVKLRFGLPEAGCRGCSASGGSCGFDTETQGALCICSATFNSTTTCAAGGDFSSFGGDNPRVHPAASVFAFGMIILFIL